MLPMMLFLAAASSRVDTVVVFPDRAQVTRVAEVACSGNSAATFAEIPPAADPSSFRARVDVGEVLGLLAEQRALDERFAPSLRALEQERRKLELELRAATDARARAEKQSALGSRYADVAVELVSKEMVEPKPDVRAWSSAFDAAATARIVAAAQLADARAKERELRRQIDELRKKEARLSVSSARREHVVEAMVGCPAGRKARVELTYVVGGARWTPSYEARADEARGLVELSTYATVHQATGEKWAQAKLVLSTALPSQNATPPELRPLKVWAEEREDERKVLVRRDEVVEHARGGEGLDAQAGGQLLARPQGLSVQLEVPDRADVDGDGEAVRVFVAKTPLRARFSHRTAPKQLPYVFRVADLTNQAPFPLLPGEVDVFRATGFIARLPLDRVPQGGAFDLTFGVEESLRVKRVVVEELVREVGLFGGRRRFRYAYRFELANYGKAKREVELVEHVPLSELDDVRVELGPKTTPGYQRDSTDGLARWTVKVAAGDKQDVNLAFHVDVPSSYETGGL